MKALKQSFAWWCYEGKCGAANMPRLMAEARQIGYEAVEFVPEDQWQMVTDAGLKMSSIPGQNSLAEGMNQTAVADKVAGEIREKIGKAAKWKIPVLIVFSGNRNGLDDETGAKNCASVLARVAREAEQAGITIVLELLNSKVDHADYQCDRTAWGINVCERVNSPAVKLLYDIYHMQIMEGDIIRTIQRDHQWFGHYHTAGNPGRGPMNGDQELHYPPIYRAIAATGYTGYVAHEFVPAGDPVKELRDAYDQCVRSF